MFANWCFINILLSFSAILGESKGTQIDTSVLSADIAKHDHDLWSQNKCNRVVYLGDHCVKKYIYKVVQQISLAAIVPQNN